MKIPEKMKALRKGDVIHEGYVWLGSPLTLKRRDGEGSPGTFQGTHVVSWHKYDYEGACSGHADDDAADAKAKSVVERPAGEHRKRTS